MRYFLVSDNMDTLTGMRLAGIEGTLAQNRQEAMEALSSVLADSTIGILLINERLCALCPEVINDLKLKSVMPLVVEIPDRHHTGRSPDSITRYIQEAIGIHV